MLVPLIWYMVASRIIDVIIPAFNEEDSIQKVIHEIPSDLVREVIVVSNGSDDRTVENAKAAGATVMSEGRKGYGSACLCGIDYISKKSEQPDIVAFLDGDYSDYPEQLTQVVQPIMEEGKDMVIGSRALGTKEKASMTMPQLVGNKIATIMLKWLYGVHHTDLGPFRAIRYEALMQLQMQDTTFGWTVEMQVKAAKQKLKVCEVPVDYRKRIGTSKISGTVKGTVLAGYKIIWTILKYSK